MWGMEVALHSFLTSVILVSGQLHAPAALHPGKDPAFGVSTVFPLARSTSDKQTFLTSASAELPSSRRNALPESIFLYRGKY